MLTQIRTKVMLAVVVVAGLVGAAVLAALESVWSHSSKVLADQVLTTVRGGMEQLGAEDTRMLGATLHGLMRDPALLALFAARDRDGLQKQAQPLFDELKKEFGITHWYFIEPDGTCFLRVHQPGQHGDVIKRATLALAREKGQGTGTELGKTAFALRVVHPYSDGEGKLLGYMETGEEIDHFLGLLKAQSGADIGLLVDKRFLDAKEWEGVRSGHGLPNNWDESPDAVVVGATTAEPGLMRQRLDLEAMPATGRVLDLEERDDRTFLRAVFPMEDASKRRVGGVYIRKDVTASMEQIRAARRNISLVVAGLMAALAAVLTLLLRRLVFGRLEQVIDAATRVVGGDVQTVIKPQARDEVGELEKLLDQFRVVFVDAVEDARRARGGKP